MGLNRKLETQETDFKETSAEAASSSWQMSLGLFFSFTHLYNGNTAKMIILRLK